MADSSGGAPLKSSVESMMTDPPAGIQELQQFEKTESFRNLNQQELREYRRQVTQHNKLEHDLWKIGLMFLQSQQPDMPLLFALPHLPQLQQYVGKPPRKQRSDAGIPRVCRIPVHQKACTPPRRIGPQNPVPPVCHSDPPPTHSAPPPLGRGRPPHNYNHPSYCHEYLPWQLEQLEALYKIRPKISVEHACRMGVNLCVPAEKILGWFSRRRQADRKESSRMGQ